MHLHLLPMDNSAHFTVQNFNILVTEAPVNAEEVILPGGPDGPHVVARETDDVVLLVERWQNVLPSITVHLGDVRHPLIKGLLAP